MAKWYNPTGNEVWDKYYAYACALTLAFFLLVAYGISNPVEKEECETVCTKKSH